VASQLNQMAGERPELGAIVAVAPEREPGRLRGWGGASRQRERQQSHAQGAPGAGPERDGPRVPGAFGVRARSGRTRERSDGHTDVIGPWAVALHAGVGPAAGGVAGRPGRPDVGIPATIW